jgi:hypothetical protein
MDRDKSGTIDFDEFLVSIRVLKKIILGIIKSNSKGYCRSGL